ncbi:1,4-alpha-glucan branching enzyme [Streptomyces phaeolivaceus]|uniref:1,4-alpha-glucan branching enzyme GlgB n=1 Tax=Streptomyces phaeolivaceus TaxID=2653200 RepID=A0A5P8KAP9_9ACTN|nr:1,4-alpha-glucan branching enzyme [Streptomyces phaeolivaceus]QFR00394.1 1,4-alpha-glucan branching enzyme [Streptomyces phaeolivaceus]
MTPRTPSEDSTQHPDTPAETPAPAPAPAPVKKTAATKKTAAKKATAKKAAPAAKKTAGGAKAAPRKATVAEGTTAEGSPAKETVAKQTIAKQTIAKKTVAKKAVAKKTAKKAAKKATPAGAAPTETAPTKAVATEAVAEKPVAKKSAAKETVAKKAAAKKAVSAGAVAKKAVAKKAGTAKAVTAEAGTAKAGAAEAVTAEGRAKKAVSAGAVAKKAVAKKASARKAVKAPQDAVGAAASSVQAVPPGAGTPPVPEMAAAEPTASVSVLTDPTGPDPLLPHQTTAEPADTAPAAPDPVLPKQATTEPVVPESTGSEPPASAPAPQPASTPSALPRPAFSPAMDGGDRERLLAGTHHAPHSVLGAHPAPGGVVFRAFRPYALGVSVVVDSLRAELHDDGGGFFSALLPLREVPEAYRLLVSYEGTEQETEDAYRFLPAIGELDLYLIGEGRHEELWRALGAEPMTHQGVTGTRFTVWAPNARGVRLAGTFNFWDGSGFPMRSLGSSGVWELFVPGIGEGELYKFEITRPDGSKTLRADPMARRTEVPPHTSSIVHASHHEWTDEEWLAARTETPAHEAPFSVYEVHLSSWRPGLTYRQLAEQLPAYVSDLGFTHVELLPIAEHPFGGSWGYQVTGFYAPTARLGTPDDFKYLVDALHRAGIGVLMDWVPAHFPRDDWALAEFDGRPLYEHEDPLRAAHPDWGTLEFDYGRREVRNFLVANALYWCEEYHIDGLRVDAVASMLYLDYSREPGQWTPNEHGGRENLDAVAFLQEMNATVYRRVPGVVTIAEESTAWDGVTRATHHNGPGGFGGLGFGLKWNMGWMHDSLGYMAKEPVHRKHHHNEMTFSMVYAYSENYVLPISHDEVVHGKGSLVSKMPGDWWRQRADHRAYLGFMWAHPGKQLLFMGQEFAQGAEWSEAHGPDWWLLDPAYGAEADHRGVRDLVRDLNTVYRATPALWEQDTRPAGFSWITGDSADDNVLAFLRLAEDGTPLLSVSNFSPVVREDYRLGVPEDVPAWREVLNTDAAVYGGSGRTTPDPVKPDPHPWHARPAGIRVTLPPLSTLWLRPA